jgi:hypothetical protein
MTGAITARSGPGTPGSIPKRCADAAHMALTRAFDDRMYRAQRQGKTSFYMKCTGEEAVSVASGLCAGRRRHGVPQLSPAGHPDRARLSAGRDDQPDLFEPRRSG